MGSHKTYINVACFKFYVHMVWEVLKCGAGEGWKRSVGPIM